MKVIEGAAYVVGKIRLSNKSVKMDCGLFLNPIDIGRNQVMADGIELAAKEFKDEWPEHNGKYLFLLGLTVEVRSDKE